MTTPLDARAVGLAAFTVATNTLRTLVDKGILTAEEAKGIMVESADMHTQGASSSAASVNSDAARICLEYLTGVDW